MPFTDKDKQKAYAKSYGASWYQRNKERVKKASIERKRRLKGEWVQYKATLACDRCGASHPAIIDFHHPDREDKEHNIFRLVADGAFKKVWEEIKKCVVLCSNCHRIEHFNEQQAKRALKRAQEALDDNDSG
jgi:hypothetical protein